MVFSQYSAILDSVEKLHRMIRDAARKSIKEQAEGLAEITGDGNGDVSYGIDSLSEAIIDRWFTQNPPEGGAIVICEGLGRRVYPKHMEEAAARWRILIDPLDGTRHIMFDSRSAFILTGIAKNRGEQTALSDIIAAVQTEVPVVLQEKGAVLKAAKGQGAQLKIYDLNTGMEADTHLKLKPSAAKTLENGFCVFANYFPGTKAVISELEENVLRRLYGEPKENAAMIFSEQYICSAGLVYMLMTGKYRAVVDIRALLGGYQRKRGLKLPLCTHPYDLSATLIAKESGCILTSDFGNDPDYPMDLDTNCAWAGYANEKLYREIHPVLLEEMKALGILA